MSAGVTRWRIVQLEGWGRANVTLSVDTEGEGVIAAIERAAEGAGIKLQRVGGADDQGEGRDASREGSV